jgi:hypothetical protein
LRVALSRFHRQNSADVLPKSLARTLRCGRPESAEHITVEALCSQRVRRRYAFYLEITCGAWWNRWQERRLRPSQAVAGLAEML